MEGSKVNATGFFTSGTILSLVVFWFYSSSDSLNTFAYLFIGAMLLIIGFQIYFGVQALRNEKAGLVPHDELSRRIREIAAARAFKYSILMWVFAIIFFIDLIPVQSTTEIKMVVAFGMISMVIIYLITWFLLTKMGIDENQN